jgi:hypothetical protein
MVSRRDFLRAAVLAGVSVALALPVTGCAQGQSPESTSAQDSQATSSQESSNSAGANMETASSQESSDSAGATDETAQSSAEGDTVKKFQIEVGGKTFDGTFATTEAAEELASRLPLTLDMSELSGNEKYFETDKDFPGNEEVPSELHAGEVWIYSKDYIVLFYKDHANPGYSYQFAGSLDDPTGLAKAVGSGSVRVTIR